MAKPKPGKSSPRFDEVTFDEGTLFADDEGEGNTIETREGRDTERDHLLSLRSSMTAEQGLQVALIVGALHDLDTHADHQAHHVREHARPRVPGEQRELTYNPGRAQLILDSLRQQFTVGTRQIARYLEALRSSTPTPDAALVRRLERLQAATIAATHALHTQLASEGNLRLADGPPRSPVVSETLFPSDTLFPRSSTQ